MPIKLSLLRKNPHHYEFVRKYIVLTLVSTILVFNLVFKVDILAVGSSTSITIENLLDKHNFERAKENLSALVLNDRLAISAQNKADQMIESNCWSHYCPEGRSPWEFFNDANYQYIFAGENLAEGFYSIEVLMNAWMNSASHKENILNPNFNEIGFGITYGNYQNNENNILVVVHFGKVRDAMALGSLEITDPKNGNILTDNFIDVKGTVSNIDDVSIFLNNEFKAKGNIADGIFTSRIDNLTRGEYEVLANGVDNAGNFVNSNLVNIELNPSIFSAQDNSQSSLFVIDPGQKNIVNVVLILCLALIFLIDFIILSRTHILTTKSYSHYHFVILLVVAVVVLVGGFSGHISNGIIT